MSETHAIEKRGIAALRQHLEGQGRAVAASPRKAFDLLVDGIPAEVKTKELPWARLDFIGLTDNQRRALDGGERFLLFVVCNLKGPGAPEVHEIPSDRLANAQFKVECTHYIYGPQLRTLAGGASNTA